METLQKSLPTPLCAAFVSGSEMLPDVTVPLDVRWTPAVTVPRAAVAAAGSVAVDCGPDVVVPDVVVVDVPVRVLVDVVDVWLALS